MQKLTMKMYEWFKSFFLFPKGIVLNDTYSRLSNSKELNCLFSY